MWVELVEWKVRDFPKHEWVLKKREIRLSPSCKCKHPFGYIEGVGVEIIGYCEHNDLQLFLNNGANLQYSPTVLGGTFRHLFRRSEVMPRERPRVSLLWRDRQRTEASGCSRFADASTT